MSDARTSYRFEADTDSLVAGLRSAQGEIAKTTAAAVAGGAGFTSYQRGAKLTAQQLQQVSFQLNDLGVQIASGGSPLTALIQQGSQLSGTFGGVGNAFRAVFSLVTPVVAGFGALAATAAAVGAAYVQGYREQAIFERGLLLTGNRAGVTTDQFRSMSKAIADSTLLTVGASKEALQAAVASGKFGADSLGAAATAAGLLADRTGEAVDQIVADLGGRLSRGVARGAEDLNRQYGFLSESQFRYIRELERGGKEEDARRETLRLLADQIGRKTPTELGLLESALERTRKTWSEWWNAALNIGRPDSLGDQIDQARQKVLEAEKNLNAPNIRGAGNQGVRDARLSNARTTLETLREQQRATERAAEFQASAAETAQKAIRKINEDDAKRPAKPKKEKREPLETRQAAFRQGELGDQGGVDRALSEANLQAFEDQQRAAEQAAKQEAKRVDTARDSALQLREVNRGLSVDLIADDRERGLAAIQIERDTLAARIEALKEGSAERIAAENDLAQYVVLRQQQLAEELKPGYQRLIDDWRDTTLSMKRFSDQFMDGFVDRGRDTFVDWATSGKLSAKGLTDFIKQEFARLAYDRFLAQSTASLGNTILDGILGVVGAVAGGGGQGSNPNGYNGTANNPSAYVATPMARGTNYVPYHGFKASLHKGEAVVPAKYNPAADRRAAAQQQAAPVINQTVNVGEGVTRGEVYQAVKAANAELTKTLMRSRRRDGAFA